MHRVRLVHLHVLDSSERRVAPIEPIPSVAADTDPMGLPAPFCPATQSSHQIAADPSINAQAHSMLHFPALPAPANQKSDVGGQVILFGLTPTEHSQLLF
jgi:hypothetical protein